MKTIKKAMNGMGPGPKKKPSFLIDQKGDTLKIGTRAYAAEQGRKDAMTKALMTESPKAKEEAAKKKAASKPKMKTGGKQMLKRADGSTSQRGLWDNLRKKAAQNKKTGAKPKAPTKAMLTQERKIKAKGK